MTVAPTASPTSPSAGSRASLATAAAATTASLAYSSPLLSPGPAVYCRPPLIINPAPDRMDCDYAYPPHRSEPIVARHHSLPCAPSPPMVHHHRHAAAATAASPHRRRTHPLPPLPPVSPVPALVHCSLSFAKELDSLHARERDFCSDFRCCGMVLRDLFELLDHYEECHVGEDGLPVPDTTASPTAATPASILDSSPLPPPPSVPSPPTAAAHEPTPKPRPPPLVLSRSAAARIDSGTALWSPPCSGEPSPTILAATTGSHGGMRFTDTPTTYGAMIIPASSVYPAEFSMLPAAALEGSVPVGGIVPLTPALPPPPALFPDAAALHAALESEATKDHLAAATAATKSLLSPPPTSLVRSPIVYEDPRSAGAMPALDPMDVDTNDTGHASSWWLRPTASPSSHSMPPSPTLSSCSISTTTSSPDLRPRAPSDSSSEVDIISLSPAVSVSRLDLATPPARSDLGSASSPPRRRRSRRGQLLRTAVRDPAHSCDDSEDHASDRDSPAPPLPLPTRDTPSSVSASSSSMLGTAAAAAAGTGAHVCDVDGCGRRYRHSSGLRYHQRTVHGDEGAAPPRRRTRGSGARKAAVSAPTSSDESTPVPAPAPAAVTHACPAPGCDRTYASHSGLRYHTTHVHADLVAAGVLAAPRTRGTKVPPPPPQARRDEDPPLVSPVAARRRMPRHASAGTGHSAAARKTGRAGV
ncbi:Transcriptional regulator of ribosomal biogenesis proteins [Blastocladiella emersonii ATCC 22665]|nr:Transcriptional regulator of ribosomal biogenesis proteins [Blastocladiella emersonii ATCC 22665]